VAISVAWQTVATNITSSASLYTVPTTGNFGTYVRDLVITNSGTAIVYVNAGTGATSSAIVTSTQIPVGGTLLLTQCQVPPGTVVYGFASSAASVSIGYATNVAFI
jgi:hypothetical protein